MLPVDSNGLALSAPRRVIQQEYVKGCLAIMYSSGMGDHSGEWAFNIGVPAKSGHSGLLMVGSGVVVVFVVTNQSPHPPLWLNRTVWRWEMKKVVPTFSCRW